MPTTRRHALALIGSVLAAPAAVRSARAAADLRISIVAAGLDQPWGLAFLPDGRFLVTERGGRLNLFTPDGSGRSTVPGTPAVFARGQGGLLDVMVTRDFAASRRIWLTWAEPEPGGAATAGGFGRLSQDGARLDDFTRVHGGPAVAGGLQFGARLAEAADGTVFLTTGDRGQAPLAQDIARPEGKVLAKASSTITLIDAAKVRATMV